MPPSFPVTPEGFKRMTEELKHLKSVERPKNVEDIEIARAHGDISENAEFEAAKERQAMIAAKISDLEDKITRAQVIDPSTINSDKIVFGASLRLNDVESGETLHYQIVGGYESDIKQGKISIESPIAKSLIGKEEGDVVKVVTPRGARELEVVEVSYR